VYVPWVGVRNWPTLMAMLQPPIALVVTVPIPTDDPLTGALIFPPVVAHDALPSLELDNDGVKDAPASGVELIPPPPHPATIAPKRRRVSSLATFERVALYERGHPLA